MLKRNIIVRRSYCCLLKQWLSQNRVAMPKVSYQACYASGLAGQLSKAKSENIRTTFRTPETDPLKHDIQQEGLYYTVPEKIYENYVQPGALPGYRRLAKTFQESTIMVRKPALELFDVIDNMNLNHPPLRILLYGKLGSGKSMTLAHVMHRYAEQDWVIVNVPWVGFWVKYTPQREISMSSYRPGRVDLTAEAVDWLKLFYRQNEKHFANLQTTKAYIWTDKERAESGTPLSEIIEFGLNRPKFASDSVGAILRELRLAASAKQIKILVTVDGINGFWREARIRVEDKKQIPASHLSLVHNFKKMFSPTWSHGVCIGVLDTKLKPLDERESYTPSCLLGKEGFAEMDPFLPILVPEYSNKEAYSCLEYYIERMWIQRPKAWTDEGKQELLALSNQNPAELMKISAHW